MEKKKVVVAFSGGLDTSYTVMYLAKEKGYEVYAACANTGDSGFRSGISAAFFAVTRNERKAKRHHGCQRKQNDCDLFDAFFHFCSPLFFPNFSASVRKGKRQAQNKM